jgi:Tol biopolymer transport system component
MTLIPGSRLGPYEILSAVGAGGMGEVYRAKDTRLDRTVAVKVLPSHLSENAEFRQRFEREAKTISQLSHPHICTLHDVGNEAGVEYLVMEFLEGETLTDRLAKGPLPLEQILRFGIEIADALDKAHRQGIVHRDLKPGNVMITKSGVKLVDFGLAKLAGPAPGSVVSSLSVLPTQAEMGLTAQGTILGTFQYMAPEQLEGRDADGRTDIFALGLLLYEMVTGQKAFSGKSQASLIGAIMHSEPPSISSAKPMSPPALDRVVKTCLAKDPDDRFQTAHDVKLQLQWIGEGGSAVGLPAPIPARRGIRDRFGGAAAGLVLGAVATGLGVWWWLARERAAAPASPVRLSVVLPPDAPLAVYGPHSLAISPDGTRLVYVAEKGGGTQLYMRALGELQAVPVGDTVGASSPFFSPDSRWLGFFAGLKLKKVRVEGGPSQAICDASDVRGATWSRDDTIVFGSGTSGLKRVPAAGGSPKILTTPDARQGEVTHILPEFLPGGDSVVFGNFSAGYQVGLVSLKTGKRRNLLEGNRPRYSPTGHLVFERAGSLLAAPFDIARLEITGPAVSIADGVMSIAPFRLPLVALSGTGVLAYVPGSSPRHSLAWVDRTGKALPLGTEPLVYEEPRLSPDGSRIAVVVRGDNPDVWVSDISRGTMVRLTFEPGEDETAVWTPDGKHVTFSGDRVGRRRALYRKPADGSAGEEQLFSSDIHPHVSSWSPDGGTLLFTEYDPVTAGDIWVFSRVGKPATRPFLKTPFNERAARFSPDGRWLAYVSNESGRDEVYVQAFPGPGGKWQISSGGGTEPVWSRGGRELVFRRAEKMMAAAVTAGQTFSAENPRTLFEGRFVPTRRGEAAYDVAPDGERFLMVQREEQSVPTRIDVVLNWFEDLERRAPAEQKQ